MTKKETGAQPSGGSRSRKNHWSECESPRSRGHEQCQDRCGAECKGAGAAEGAMMSASSGKPFSRTWTLSWVLRAGWDPA